MAEQLSGAKLLAQAENRTEKREKKGIRITVAEFLFIAQYPINSGIVKDTEGRIWEIPETIGNSGPYKGLVSRYNLDPGTELLLNITETTIRHTDAFVVREAPEPERNKT